MSHQHWSLLSGLCPFKSMATVIRAVPDQQRHLMASLEAAGLSFPVGVGYVGSMLPFFCVQCLQLIFISSHNLSHTFILVIEVVLGDTCFL